MKYRHIDSKNPLRRVPRILGVSAMALGVLGIVKGSPELIELAGLTGVASIGSKALKNWEDIPPNERPSPRPKAEIS